MWYVLLEILLLFAGFGLLYVGGNGLVKNAITLAKGFDVPAWVIGITIVAFGTSAPELAVNVRAAIGGNEAISFGNIFGSNIANIALILALCAILKPLSVHKQLVRKTIPMLLVFTGLATFMVLDPVRELGRIPEFDHFDGVILLILFGCFLYLIYRHALGKPKRALLPGAVEEVGSMAGEYPPKKALLFVFGSLVFLLVGAELTVHSAVYLAGKADISEAVIGLTVIAFGTSLPELAVGLIATLKGHYDLAVGNVVGSNIFNLLLVMGVTSTIAKVPLPEDGHGGEDLIVVCWVAVLLYLTALTQKRISRTEGWILLVIYLGYTTWRFFFSGSGA